MKMDLSPTVRNQNWEQVSSGEL